MPGPVLSVKPGDRLRVTLVNGLDFPTQSEMLFTGIDATVALAVAACEPYKTPNTTSLHFHGLHVTTEGLGDGPYRMAVPHETIVYDVNIPDAHPPGTFWYHPHDTGATSLQLAQLMAGALVVEDTVATVGAAWYEYAQSLE